MTTSPEVFVKTMHVLDLISQGELPTPACNKAFLSTFLFKQAIRDPLIAELAADAFERGYDALADILIDIDTNIRYGSSDPKIMRVKSDNIKWLLSKRDQARYGEKVVIENRITADKAITEALSRGKQRAIAAARNEVIDAVAVEVIQHVDISQFM